MVDGPIHRPRRDGPPIVALGGGHGLSATLKALRRITGDVTAIVGVADDGGSSGRLRDEFGVVPPGDLRMALAALCGDDEWGRTWSSVMQHRFPGDGELSGHATGNILIAALWQETGDIVEGLDWVAALLGVHGRVLPVANVPLDIVADVADWNDDSITWQVRGQVELEHTNARVLDLRVEPADPVACPHAVAALHAAEAIVLGPGSWYTSVLPHLLVEGVRTALSETEAQKILVLNLDANRADTASFTSADYLTVWAEQFPEVELDFVLADTRYVDDVDLLTEACARVSAELVLERIAAPTSPSREKSARHDAHLLAATLADVLSRGNISSWQ